MPFTEQQFLDVFARYNLSIWPAHVIFYALALGSLLLVTRRSRLSDTFAVAVLTMMWTMAGAGYHITFFSRINPAAYVFGAAFLLQAVLLLSTGIVRNRVRLEYRPGVATWVGWILVGYAMVLYTMLGSVLGHRYPEAPMFGVAPCPVTIFTFGLLLWARKGLPKYLLVIPALWSLLGFVAALKLGIYQDYGLFAAGLVAVPMILRHGQHSRVHAQN